jgi:hypothetical protein
VSTFNGKNVDQVDEVLKRVEDAGHRIAFNVFSIPKRNQSALGVNNILTENPRQDDGSDAPLSGHGRLFTKQR